MEKEGTSSGSHVEEKDPPRRKSRRLQCAPPEVKQEPGLNNSGSWKPIEKLALLKALKEHGSSDPQKLARKVKTRSVNEIKYYLNTNMDRIRNAHFKSLAETAEAEGRIAACSEEEEHYQRLASLPPIDLWKRIVWSNIPLKNKIPDYSLVLAEIYKDLGEQEEELDIPYAPNFKAIYKFIEDTMRGCIPAQLTPVDAYVMDFLLTELSKIMDLQKASEQFIMDFDGPVAYVPSSIVEGAEWSYDNSKPVSRKIQSAARRLVADKKKELITPVPDKAYGFYYQHQKIRDNLNPMGVHPWLLQESSDIIIDYMKKRFSNFTPP